MNNYRFWTDAMLRHIELELKVRLQNMRKLAEKGYDVAERFEQAEVELLEITQEQQRRAELQSE